MIGTTQLEDNGVIMRHGFKPKNPTVFNLMERLTQKPAIHINSDLAKQLGRYEEIKFLRRKNLMYIGKDRLKNKSIIMVDGVRIVKQNGRFYFKGF